MPDSQDLSARRGLSIAELAAELAAFQPRLEGASSTRVTGVRQDSREVRAGDLFVARLGGQFDGRHFAAQAVQSGASALLVGSDAPLPDLGVPLLRVRDVQRAASFAAEAVYGFPSRALRVIGITGTNGKTTSSGLLDQALHALGTRSARLGTLGFAFEGRQLDAALTTPEADVISRCMAEVRDLGGTHFVMEVSSIALELDRVAALRFEIAALTNLTQDHLDFHGSMAAYATAKTRLFSELGPRLAVLNGDDSLGRELAERAQSAVIAVGHGEGNALRTTHFVCDASGIRATLAFGAQRCELQSRLVGAHNLENLMLALGVLLGLGHDLAPAAAALAQAKGVPGRLERCDESGDDVLVLVDYAHTPDALTRVLDALRPLTRGELSCVFGCGGDRDPNKRAKMGAAVAAGADRAFVTNDNPRTEDPARIVEAILPPLHATAIPVVVELDRARAIERAVLAAQAGDTVLLAGKGHETYQIFGNERRPFDDRAEARRALALRRAGRAR